jgi:hypothetical protein
MTRPSRAVIGGFGASKFTLLFDISCNCTIGNDLVIISPNSSFNWMFSIVEERTKYQVFSNVPTCLNLTI